MTTLDQAIALFNGLAEEAKLMHPDLMINKDDKIMICLLALSDKLRTLLEQIQDLTYRISKLELL